MLAAPVLAQNTLPLVQGDRGPEAARPYVQVDSAGVFFGNRNVDLLTLTAASVGANGADQVHAHGRGLHLVIDVTAITGTVTPTLTVFIEGKDPASGKYYTILSSAGITTVSTVVLKVYPGITATANVAVADVLPATWRVRYTITGTTPAFTARLGALYVF
jgi:hypothetical protein